MRRKACRSTASTTMVHIRRTIAAGRIVLVKQIIDAASDLSHGKAEPRLLPNGNANSDLASEPFITDLGISVMIWTKSCIPDVFREDEAGVANSRTPAHPNKPNRAAFFPLQEVGFVKLPDLPWSRQV